MNHISYISLSTIVIQKSIFQITRRSRGGDRHPIKQLVLIDGVVQMETASVQLVLYSSRLFSILSFHQKIQFAL
jgi:hypothetical protein